MAQEPLHVLPDDRLDEVTLDAPAWAAAFDGTTFVELADLVDPDLVDAAGEGDGQHPATLGALGDGDGARHAIVEEPAHDLDVRGDGDALLEHAGLGRNGAPFGLVVGAHPGVGHDAPR